MTTPSTVSPWLVKTERRYCRPCGQDVVSKPRLRLAGLGLASIVLLVLAMIGFSALIGPFIMFTAPLVLVAGCALGPLASLMSEPPSCPACHRDLVFASRRDAARETERVRPHRAATVGDMKAA